MPAIHRAGGVAYSQHSAPPSLHNRVNNMRINSYDDYKAYLHADLIASGLSRWGIVEWLRCDVMRFQRLLRKVEFVRNCSHGWWWSVYLLYLRWQLRNKGRYLGCEVGTNVFGPGLTIVHPCGIVVSDQAVIGKNCRIHAGVNIGIHRGRAPRIGDNVYLGPGAKIVGGVVIGDNAVVGANAVVVNDVPPGVTVGGVPAKTISTKDSSEMIPLKGL